MARVDTILPPVKVYEMCFKDYFYRVKNEVSSWALLAPSEVDRCARLREQIDNVPEISKKHDLLKRGAAYLVSLGIGIPVYWVYNAGRKEAEERVPPMPLAFIIYLPALIVVDYLDDNYTERGKTLKELSSRYQNYCVDLPYRRLEEAAKEVFAREHPLQMVSVEVMAARYPSAWVLFKRDAWNAAEQFSDTMVATAAHDAKVVGQFAKDVIAPVAIGAALVYGLAKMVETGDTSIMQRAWAMVR